MAGTLGPGRFKAERAHGTIRMLMGEGIRTDGPLIAVVIPVWDDYVERGLREAVASVAGQGMAARIIVVENASRTPVPRLDGVRIVRTGRRLSRGAARNVGLKAVTEPFVVFLDADDVMLPGSLRALFEGLTRTPDAVAHVCPIVDASGRLFRAPRRIGRLASSRPGLFAFVNTAWSVMPIQGATILRTDAVRAAGGYGDRDTSEDWMLGARLAARGRVTFGSTPALIYRRGPGDVSLTTRELLDGARAVRAHVARDPQTGRRARLLSPAVRLTQGAVVTARPVVLALRRARRRRAVELGHAAVEAAARP
jgi:cellulose synthase/poly-beta-1,6-N-acetylglucosamine synthase-like glycosyltransferase